jgi:U32 family peptidase
MVTRNKPVKYELLAPVGNFTNLRVAIDAGADAIYFGLKEFSLRSNAGNFSVKDVDKIKKLCDEKGVRLYLTMNSIIYNEELNKINDILKKLKNKVDAVICWDLGVIGLAKKHKIPIHISTQASVSNIESAKFYKGLGAERIVLARELNLKQIKEISKFIDVECFAHGAMCMAISGRCFTSQFLFGKSANRGECIHPCRRSYIVKDKQGYEKDFHATYASTGSVEREGYELEVQNDKIMSAKDLCTLPFIEKMKKAGIISFKIEGRNRDPRYVDTVIRVYRKALDKKLTEQEIKQAVKELSAVYNKGFSTGFYFGVPTSDDFSKIEHSQSQEMRHFVGKVGHYYNKVSVATVNLVSELKIGDRIIVVGKTTGLVNSTVERIEIKGKKFNSGKKGQEVGIKLPLVKKNDEVYVIKKRYKK